MHECALLLSQVLSSGEAPAEAGWTKSQKALKKAQAAGQQQQKKQKPEQKDEGGELAAARPEAKPAVQSEEEAHGAWLKELQMDPDGDGDAEEPSVEPSAADVPRDADDKADVPRDAADVPRDADEAVKVKGRGRGKAKAKAKVADASAGLSPEQMKRLAEKRGWKDHLPDAWQNASELLCLKI